MHRVIWLTLFMVTLQTVAHAQITVSGIANHNITYADSVCFQVFLTNGYVGAAFLDGHSVPLELTTCIDSPDYHELLHCRH